MITNNPARPYPRSEVTASARARFSDADVSLVVEHPDERPHAVLGESTRRDSALDRP
jgi:hypothetical protein